MKNEKKRSSGIPLAIIVIVLIAAVAGGYWFYNSSKSVGNANRAASNSNSSRTPPPPVNAPAGAQPPNMLGSPTALVTVEEFADFQCGSCAAVHPVMKEVQSIYGSRIKFMFRHYPLAIPAHDKAFDAAVAAEAAGMQGKFWAMQDQLFVNQQAWSINPNYRQLWLDYANKIGLDIAKFQTDIAGIGAKSRVELDLQRGKGLSVNSTPSIFINGRSIPFPEVNVASLRQVIDAELQQAASKTQAANTGGASAASPAATNSANGK